MNFAIHPAPLLDPLPITSGVVAVHYLLTVIKTESVAQILHAAILRNCANPTIKVNCLTA